MTTKPEPTDLMNFAGVCVIAGNVRRTAELGLGEADDTEFLDLKNYRWDPASSSYTGPSAARSGWGWASNNSVFARVGQDYDEVAGRIAVNGEPGLFWLDNVRAYSRMKDGPDHKDRRAKGTNPCGEQSLEDGECCCLVENFPARNDSIADFRRTLKYSYLYAKTVTLVPTHWPKTNAIMMRNRRIGSSLSGVVQFLKARGEKRLIEWCEKGYDTIDHYDRVYSEWLGVRESIKKTSIKPSGTVSLPAGATPGAHYPTYRDYIRRIRFAVNHPDVQSFRDAGYRVVPDNRDPDQTVVVEFPVRGPDVPTEREVSLAKKMHLAVLLQRHWADNQVSFTATFLPEEAPLIPDLLRAYDKSLKSISFLPLTEQPAYDQMPYEPISPETYERLTRDLKPIVWTYGDSDTHDTDELYCTTDKCERLVPQ